MKDHYNYSLVDFLLDDSFVEWVKQNCPDDHVWTDLVRQYPNKEEDVSLAKEIIISLKVTPVKELSVSEVQNIVDAANERLMNNGDQPAIASRGKILPYGFWFKVAAAILLIAILSVFVREYQPDTTRLLSEAIQKLPEIQKDEQLVSHEGLIKLPDGTSVILKQGSSLRYAAKFNGRTREVHLSGEAYFEVKKDPSRPFLVYSNELVTKVLGTSFSVKAWKDDKKFKVTVTTGKVAVFTKNNIDNTTVQSSSLIAGNKRGILVAPNQEVTLHRRELKLVKLELPKPSLLSEEIAKTEFNFVETPFSEVVATLSKAYDVPVIYDERKMATCPLTASLTNQSFYEKLLLICKAVEATFEMREGKVVIKGKGCNDFKLTDYESNETDMKE